MKKGHHSLLIFILLYGGCTKNNQNTPSTFSYLNVNQTYAIPVGSNSNPIQSYDIDNDGQVDWGFSYAEGDGLVSYGHYTSYVMDSIFCLKHLTVGSNINSTLAFGSPQTGIPFLLGSVPITDFYVGFKSQNPSFTNSFYGWIRLNMAQDGRTLIVKDMAMNKVNGGGINVGQH